MVEVYAIRIPGNIDKALFDALLTKVDPEKRRRINRFIRMEDKIRGLFSDLLIRFIIMQKTGMSNEEISFATNEYGKPHLKGRNDFHFNLSHSGIWVVAAVDSQPVGIDVEQIGDIDLNLSKNFFSEDEHNDLMNTEDKVSYFFTLWTLKESFIKITGRGLSQPLNSFSLKYITEDQIILKSAEGKPIDGVCFAQYHIHRDYKLMLCAGHNNLPKNITMHSMDRLVTKFIQDC